MELDAAKPAGRLRHDGKPVREWCLGNAVGKADRRGSLFPTKQRSDQKIDAAIAPMMAIGRAMSERIPMPASMAFSRGRYSRERFVLSQWHSKG